MDLEETKTKGSNSNFTTQGSSSRDIKEKLEEEKGALSIKKKVMSLII